MNREHPDSGRITTSGAADLPEALRASHGQAPAQPVDFTTLGAAMRAIQQAIGLIGAPTDERMHAVRRVLRGAVIVAEDDGKVAPLPSTAYAALPESFLEIPDVQDESGINAYYSREVVLECIDAALASHGQAPAGAAHEADSAPAVGYPPLPNLDGSDEQIWEAIFNWKTATPGADAVRKANKVENAIIGTMRACVDADRAARAPADSVQEDAARLLALEAAANQIFNNPPSETSQDVRDVIEWFSGSIRVVLDAARKQGASQ